MSTLTKKLFLALVVGSTVLLMGASCSKSTANNSNSSTINSTSPVSTNQINISNFAFDPSNIMVSAGTAVTWMNNDSTTHTVTSNDGKFNSSLNPGESFSFKFNDAGTFSYHCTIHPSMTGQVIVQ